MRLLVMLALYWGKAEKSISKLDKLLLFSTPAADQSERMVGKPVRRSFQKYPA